ncbi:FtsW/RodA/SpoVE family cell cycle protein [Algisphaera agarilytica]|uniref:Cell wall polymerase n=1 Tax=Algisphaera agarilytica TaxID=1385975 RepID=A0A7X0H988_9BACT|nr:FtsW/RodA/SpoVE family cell cycle protein [Algisphaera agarilytica]MBB6431437.1 cell division protein FtsW (lipid II flippase) [Algisphaera agarilytica]
MIEAAAARLRDLLRPNFGWITLVAAIALAAMGIMAQETVETLEPGISNSQKRNLVVALAAMVVMLIPHPRVIGWLAYPMFGLAIALLIFLLIPFVPESIVRPRNGTRGWIDLKVMDFQPSEMAKVTFVIALGWYLRYRESHRSFWGLVPPFLFMLVPVMLIIVQPDLGQSLAFGPALLVVLIAAGAKLRHLFSVVGMGVMVIAINVTLVLMTSGVPGEPDYAPWLKSYQKSRITSMIKLASGDYSEVQDESYQQHKAMTLAGAGGTQGYGGERSETFIEFYKLPEAHNDMIYAVVVNRWGMLGGFAMMGLYLLLIGSMLAVAAATKEPLGRLACVGFAGIFLAQAVINIGMTVGVLPITGITLPLVSYGGSSLLFSFIMVGLVMNFASRRATYMSRPSFEFDGRAGRRSG